MEWDQCKGWTTTIDRAHTLLAHNTYTSPLGREDNGTRACRGVADTSLWADDKNIRLRLPPLSLMLDKTYFFVHSWVSTNLTTTPQIRSQPQQHAVEEQSMVAAKTLFKIISVILYFIVIDWQCCLSLLGSCILVTVLPPSNTYTNPRNSWSYSFTMDNS